MVKLLEAILMGFGFGLGAALCNYIIKVLSANG
jgi:hypothetical protein